MASAPRAAHVDLEQTRKQAKDLVKAFKAGDAKTLDRIRWNHPRFRGLQDNEILAREFVLADAQLVIARLHEFRNWPALLRHIETVARRDPLVMRFEAAADATIAGDVATLRGLLAAHPDLVRQRSTRTHRAPLLHYVAANGVEGYRQVTPPNAAEVAGLLLDAGAEVDAASEAYGGGSTALGLVATSAHPRRAGVQIALIDLLLGHGAAIDGFSPGGTVKAALANNCPEAAEALVERGARVDEVPVAAGVGRLDLVRQLAQVASKGQLERALIMAARYGRRDVVEYLLDAGVDVGASDGMTALHWAAGEARVEMVGMLIERGAPLEAKNEYGGTVLGGTLWLAFNADAYELARRDYPAVIDSLIAAGARTDLHPEMKGWIAEVYNRAGKDGPRLPGSPPN